MTKWLVYTNIASVMGENERNREQTRLCFIKAGKAEFLEKGYTQACLRDICKRANVTTGAFYFSFANKEALLHAILGPAVEQYRKLMQELYVREAANPETAIENDRMPSGCKSGGCPFFFTITEYNFCYVAKGEHT